MTEENTEVRDPQGLLKAYNALKEEIRQISAERDALQEQVKNNDWRDRALAAEVKSALAGRGLKNADRLIKVLGLDGLDFNDNGELQGFDEKLKSAAKDFPELFDPKRIVGGRADIGEVKPSDSEEDPMRAQIRAAMGGSR